MFPSLRPRRGSTFTVISDETLLSEEYCRNMPRMFFREESAQLSSHDDYLSNIDVDQDLRENSTKSLRMWMYASFSSARI